MLIQTDAFQRHICLTTAQRKQKSALLYRAAWSRLTKPGSLHAPQLTERFQQTPVLRSVTGPFHIQRALLELDRRGELLPFVPNDQVIDQAHAYATQ